jgi:putative toxin-antitoxin system antitoxin component (TIGR02293 family)
MENEKELESPESDPTEAPAISPALLFPRYVVTEVYRRIEHKLGLQGIRSDDDLAWRVQRRLPVSTTDALTLHGMSEREIHRLIVPRRCLAAHREKDELLTCEESDRAMRIVRFTSLAEWVFGDDVKAGRWLRHPFRKHEPGTPLDFLRRKPAHGLSRQSSSRLPRGLSYDLAPDVTG